MLKPEKREIRIPKGARMGTAQEPIYGWRIEPALCLSGLAVHKTLKGERWKWTVTHEASGLQLTCLGGMTQAVALANMNAALALPFDWTKGEKETLQAMRDTPGIVETIRKIGERD